MNQKRLLLAALCLLMMVPTYAQWNKWDTHRTISSVLDIANKSIESAERKKEMEIQAQQKVEFEQSFRTL